MRDAIICRLFGDITRKSCGARLGQRSDNLRIARLAALNSRFRDLRHAEPLTLRLVLGGKSQMMYKMRSGQIR